MTGYRRYAYPMRLVGIPPEPRTLPKYLFLVGVACARHISTHLTRMRCYRILIATRDLYSDADGI